MASRLNDGLNLRTEVGTVNYYDSHQSVGTCAEKSHAARLGGHSHNPITHAKETVLAHLRNPEHYVHRNGYHNSMCFRLFV